MQNTSSIFLVAMGPYLEYTDILQGGLPHVEIRGARMCVKVHSGGNSVALQKCDRL